MTAAFALEESAHAEEERIYAQPPGGAPTFTLSLRSGQELPAWLDAVATRVSHLLRLPQDWAGPNSRPIEPRLAETLIVDVLPRILPANTDAAPHIVPLVDGGLQLEWHQGGWDVEVELTPLGVVWVDCSRVDGSSSWDGRLSEREYDLGIVLKEIT
ncbi:MAG: hypothetical protein JWN95_3762 [Frankiales bacterium]|nr:hypothetical protein [Frankiales bacterium]